MDSEDYLNNTIGITIQLSGTEDQQNEGPTQDFDLVPFEDGSYSILRDLKNIGTIKKTNGQWHWTENGLPEPHAEEIGKAIEELKR